MMGDIIVSVLVLLLYIDSWWTIRNHTKDIDDLSVKYSIANESIRDLKTRVRFLEMSSKNEKARSASPKVERVNVWNEMQASKKAEYDKWIKSHPPIKAT